MRIVENIEFDSFPPPSPLIKLTRASWAAAMIANGRMRFGNLAGYRRWESALLGDPNEGVGILSVNGHTYTTESAEPIFAWCSSLSAISPNHLKSLAAANEYDCVLFVMDAELLIRRVKRALVGHEFWLQCASVNYNKSADVGQLHIVNSQALGFHLFQKDQRFSPDQEYRLALTDIRGDRNEQECIFIELGDCSDILEVRDIESFPSTVNSCRPP